jgi:ABC-type multidrug transport system fused ATPase/permease subunit
LFFTFVASLVISADLLVVFKIGLHFISIFFLESTPIGRLVQRFSKDLDQIDQQLPNAIGQLFSSSFAIISALTSIAVVTPTFSVVMLPVLGMYLSYTVYYRTVARELKRLEAISRSPIYSHFAETLDGLPLLRIFKKEAQFRRTNEQLLDENIATFNSLKVVDRWLSVRLELLGNVVVLLSALLAVLSGGASSSSSAAAAAATAASAAAGAVASSVARTRAHAGTAGLSLNNALGMTSLLNWAVRNAAETEALMNSVERVAYTIEKTPREAAKELHTLDAAHAFPFDLSHYQEFLRPETMWTPPLAATVTLAALAAPASPASPTTPVPFSLASLSVQQQGKGSTALTTVAVQAGTTRATNTPVALSSPQTYTSSSSSTSSSLSPSSTSPLSMLQETAEYVPLPQSDAALLQAGWPWRGELLFRGVQLRYRADAEPVLRDVDLSIGPGQRIGIVGRTGSGKRYANKV